MRPVNQAHTLHHHLHIRAISRETDVGVLGEAIRFIDKVKADLMLDIAVPSALVVEIDIM